MFTFSPLKDSIEAQLSWNDSSALISASSFRHDDCPLQIHRTKRTQDAMSLTSGDHLGNAGTATLVTAPTSSPVPQLRAARNLQHQRLRTYTGFSQRRCYKSNPLCAEAVLLPSPFSMPSKRKPLSYLDVARCLFELETDLKTASKNLGQSTIHLVQSFDAIATQLHSVDLQGAMPPVKPQWKIIRRDYLELLSLLRSNVLTLSARIKMFCTVVLPLSVRPSGANLVRSHQEKVHVLQSYMTISAEQASLAFSLVEKAVSFNSVLSNFHMEIARATSQRTPSSPRELQDLAQKMTLLHKSVKQLYGGSCKLSCPHATYPAFTAFRLISSAGQQTAKTKLSRYQLTLDSNLSHMSTLFQNLDDARNEIAHAQYTAKMSHRTSEVLSATRTAISDLVPNEMLVVEAILSLVMAIWLRLQADCLDIANWVQNTAQEPPPGISAYLQGFTIYATLSSSLDSYAEAIDMQTLSSSSLL
ncbi:hypothetical protein C8F01DRAFT_342843 [Mycena amicta]|nr:hypothetical protein C8F01DRAFT_342843 [Mycena amicta]